MATFIWQGNGAGTKTDMQDGRNWVNELGTAYATARYPGSVTGEQDDMIMSSALGSYSAPKTNTNFSAKEVLRSLHISNLYDGDIGDASNFLHIQCLSAILDLNVAGNVWIKGETAGATNITNLSVTGGKANKTLWLDGKIQNTLLLKHEGTIDIAATAVLSSVFRIRHVGAPATDVHLVTVHASATLPANVYHEGGNVNNSVAISGTYYGSNGTWTQLVGNIAAYELSGALLDWRAGNIGAGIVYSGELNGENTNTVKRCSNITLYAGGKVSLNDGVGNIIFDGYLYNLGSNLVRLPVGYKIDRYSVDSIAGASDAVLGFTPQSIAASGVVNGSAVLLGINDTLLILCQVGATDVTTAAFEVYQDATTAHSTEAALAGKSVTFNATDDNKTKAITVKGYELGVGKYSVRIKATMTGGTAALCSAAYILKKP